jgi:hypothetical protein
MSCYIGCLWHSSASSSRRSLAKRPPKTAPAGKCSHTLLSRAVRPEGSWKNSLPAAPPSFSFLCPRGGAHRRPEVVGMVEDCGGGAEEARCRRCVAGGTEEAGGGRCRVWREGRSVTFAVRESPRRHDHVSPPHTRAANRGNLSLNFAPAATLAGCRRVRPAGSPPHRCHRRVCLAGRRLPQS